MANVVKRMNDIVLMVPGPTMLSERVIRAMSRQAINHRSEPFRKLYKRLVEKLRYIFRTEKGEIFILTSSGTGGMEAALANIIEPNDKVIVPIYGNFSQRMADIARVYGANVICKRYPLGEAPRLEDIKALLDEHEDAKALALVYNETSTGVVVRELEAICREARRRGVLTVVDAISILGGEKLEVDAWKVDICVGATQKCLAAPPGLALLSVSQEAWEVIEKTKAKSYYFDLKRYKRFREEKWETPFTPALHLMFALDEALDMIREVGLDNWIMRQKICSEALYEGIEGLGLEIFPKREWRSPTVIAVRYPQGIDDVKFRNRLADIYHIEVAGGFGELRGKIFRIGCMGIVSRKELFVVVTSIADNLTYFGYRADVGAAISRMSEVLRRL